MKKVLVNIGVWLCAVILLWVLISYLEIATHNLNPDYVYWKHNAFRYVIKMGEWLYR